MSGMGFDSVSNLSGLVQEFGAGTSRVAFEMGTDGVASSIPGLGQSAVTNTLDVSGGMSGSSFDLN